MTTLENTEWFALLALVSKDGAIFWCAMEEPEVDLLARRLTSAGWQAQLTGAYDALREVASTVGWKCEFPGELDSACSWLKDAAEAQGALGFSCRLPLKALGQTELHCIAGFVDLYLQPPATALFVLWDLNDGGTPFALIKKQYGIRTLDAAGLLEV